MILVNKQKVEIEYYPNQESKVKEFPVNSDKNIVELIYENDWDLIHLYFVTEYIADKVVKNNYLVIHYMPYSRMDRKIDGDLFTLQYICNFINEMGYDEVIVVDPHSTQTIDMLRRVKPIYPILNWISKIMVETKFNANCDCIILPDEGARKKYEKLGLFEQPSYIYPNNFYFRSFKKQRCPTTGKILSMELTKPLPKDCKKCIIIDDLCSKGGTFKWAADILRENGVEDITLVVTHCEDTIFDGELPYLDSPIDRIYTSDSMPRHRVSHAINVLPINYLDYVGPKLAK